MEPTNIYWPKYGYFPKASKSYLIVKEDQLPNATVLFHNLNVNITVKGKRHWELLLEVAIINVNMSMN